MASRIALDLILTGYAWLVGLYDEIWQASPCFGRVAARIINECRGINRGSLAKGSEIQSAIVERAAGA